MSQTNWGQIQDLKKKFEFKYNNLKNAHEYNFLNGDLKGLTIDQFSDMLENEEFDNHDLADTLPLFDMTGDMRSGPKEVRIYGIKGGYMYAFDANDYSSVLLEWNELHTIQDQAVLLDSMDKFINEQW